MYSGHCTGIRGLRYGHYMPTVHVRVCPLCDSDVLSPVQSQVGNLCLLASLSFPPPILNSLPATRGPELRQEVEVWHSRACKRLCVVARQLLLISKQKGDIYLGGLAQIVEAQVT